jgi:glutamate-1-semialdehyde 2,1-aminomutase
MLHEGVHIFHGGGLLSIGHTDDVIEQTLKAFENALLRMRELKMI